jgi:hypothetical protein
MILALLAYVQLAFVCHLWSTVSALKVIQIVISGLNTITPAYPTVKYGTESGNKKKALSFADKFDIIKKVDTQMHVTQIKLAEIRHTSFDIK